VDTQQLVQIIAGVLAVVCVVIIFVRRKKKKADVEDDF
jgi:LPXTG-motif cell wall-anchored protein